MSIDELADLVGRQPSRARRHINPPFVPSGADPAVPANVAVFNSEPYDSDDIELHQRSLLPLLERLAGRNPGLDSVDVSLGIRSRDMGNLYVIDRYFLEAMSNAGADLVIDAYNEV